jgi:Amt family ammonium transporter
MIDFAGCGVVHMVGGFAGLVGATILGPRTGRFDSNGEPTPNFGGHSMTMVVLGTFCLWFGWYGFNPGSMMAINGATNLEIVGRSAVTTTMSGAAGGVTSLLVNRVMNGHYDLGQVCNGVLCGLVAITSGCAVVEPGAALLAGFVAAFIFDFASRTLLKLRIDDPLCASPMHGFCGAWGLLFTGLFAKEQYVLQVYPDNSSYGLFYGGGGELLGCQVTGMVTIFAWVVGTMGPFFWILRKTGNLRASPDEEEMGLDVSHHGGYAYEQNGVGKNSL